MNQPPPAYPSPELLADIVRQELDATGLSEREIERRTGISRHTLDRQVKAGDVKSGKLVAIARLLGIPLSDLMRKAEAAERAA